MYEININTHPFWITFIVFFIGICTESFYSYKYISGLRKRYPDMWEYLGKPTLISDCDLIGAWGTIKRLYNKKYVDYSKHVEHDDKGAILYCERFRSPMLISYILGWVGVIIFFGSLLIFGSP